MHPADMIFFWARSKPEQPALIQPDMVVTYRELAEAIETVSRRVEHYGFNNAEPVAVSIYQPIQKLAVCFALLRRGISVAPVSRAALPHLRPNGISNLIFTGEGMMMSGGRNIRFEDSWLKRDGKSSTNGYSARESLVSSADTIHLLPGAPGGPKKTIVPSSALMARIRMLPLIGEANYDSALIVPSVDSTFGFCRAAVNLYAGKTACFAGNYAAQLLLINTFNIDALVCTAAEATDLIDYIGKSPIYRLDSLREVWIESDYLTKDLGRKIQTHLCRNVIAGYSSAEAGRIGYANFDMIADIPNAVGFVVPDVTVEIVDNDDMSIAPGEEGRVRCRAEYYSRMFAVNNPERASEADNVWCYPGDRGHLTSDGMLCISR
jgi:non-ribosomal peptide synthetase component E (peptide arylation enzyme)